MYKVNIEKFDIYDILCLSDDKSGSFLKIVPEKGATVFDLRLDSQNIYDGYRTFEDLENLAWGRGILLAPFPNRLKEGKYSFEGKDYQFPVNNPETGTALHGFISLLEFTLGEVETSDQNCSVSCYSQYDGRFEYFPFPFKAEVKYSLDNKDGFKLRFSIVNCGKSNMPIGLGWHPYFSLDENVDDTILKLPKLDIVEIDENMIPTGKETPFTAFEKANKIDDFVLDNCFSLDKKSKLATVVLEGEKGRLIYTQKTDIPYLQVFTPPHRESIALEPMTCNVDAFNNGQGLRILKPNETIELVCQVKLEKKGREYI